LFFRLTTPALALSAFRQQNRAMDLEALAAAGLYDPAAPDAAERRELLEFLTDQGCTLEEMVAAHARGRLFGLAGDRIIRPDRDQFTLGEVAGKLDADPAIVRRLWRAFGLVEADPDSPVASPDDVEMLRVAVAMAAVLGVEPTVGFARVMGSAMARIGDASSTVVRTNLPQLSLSVSNSEIDTARGFASLAATVPALGRALDTLFRHHIEAARMHFERTDSSDVFVAGGIRIGVGFADLCGFTGLTQQLTMDGLSQLLSAFEEVAGDIVADHGGRLVKFIGDAVMFVTHDAVSAVAVAEGLVEAAEQRGLRARAGVAAGTALALDGDYFGPVVNLAARLVALAQPGDVLASQPVVERLGDRRRTESLGPQQLRGFDEPVVVTRLLPDP
jgi:class 3 adenylate cyclase